MKIMSRDNCCYFKKDNTTGLEEAGAL